MRVVEEAGASGRVHLWACSGWWFVDRSFFRDAIFVRGSFLLGEGRLKSLELADRTIGLGFEFAFEFRDPYDVADTAKQACNGHNPPDQSREGVGHGKSLANLGRKGVLRLLWKHRYPMYFLANGYLMYDLTDDVMKAIEKVDKER